jgi:hypothetical protein
MVRSRSTTNAQASTSASVPVAITRPNTKARVVLTTVVEGKQPRPSKARVSRIQVPVVSVPSVVPAVAPSVGGCSSSVVEKKKKGSATAVSVPSVPVKKQSAWIAHVKQYCTENGCSYKEALKLSKATYKT